MRYLFVTILTASICYSSTITEIESQLLNGNCDEAVALAKDYSEGAFSVSTESKLRKSDLVQESKTICAYIESVRSFVLDQSNYAKEYPTGLKSTKRPYYFLKEHFFTTAFVAKIDSIEQLKKYHDKISTWKNLGVRDSLDIIAWSTGSISQQEAREWIKAGFSYSESFKWISNGVSRYNAIDFNKQGLSIDDVKDWYELYRSGSIKNIKEWKNSGLSNSEAKDWLLFSNNLNEILSWKLEGFTAEEAKQWSSASFDVGSMNISASFLPKDAKKWKDASYSPDVAARYSSLNPNDVVGVKRVIASSCKDSVKDMSEIWAENPYDSKGKCFEGYFTQFQLLDKYSGLFKRADGEESPVVKISTTKKSIPVGEIYGIFKSAGAYSYTNAIGVKQITIQLNPIQIFKTE